MTLRKLVLLTMVSLVVGETSLVRAQQKPEILTRTKPDFSGTWVGVSPTEAKGHQQEIRHTATSLSFVKALGGETVSYPLDGKERLSESKAADDERLVTATTSSWIGEKVVIAKVITSPLRRTVHYKETFSLDSSGRLVIEFYQEEEGLRTQSMTMTCTKKASTD